MASIRLSFCFLNVRIAIELQWDITQQDLLFIEWLAHGSNMVTVKVSKNIF